MGYDCSGRLTEPARPARERPDPAAGYLTEWAYDDVDHVSTLTDARGNVTDFAYYDNELPGRSRAPTAAHARGHELRVRRRQPALENDRPAQRRRDAPLLAGRAAEVG